MATENHSTIFPKRWQVIDNKNLICKASKSWKDLEFKKNQICDINIVSAKHNRINVDRFIKNGKGNILRCEIEY